ncbi:hypothetical protein QOZ80_2AG0109050 [Eleusine coracana subsp. coracana]|nr:hypothetical protein QOZ80_2AG0109050 [Eleusine coracana subsp. coracana]
MEKSARVIRSGSHRSAIHTLPEDLLVGEILVRLPAKDLLRCRAVCSSWRRLTSGADFLLAHHRRQPSLPLVSFRGQTNSGDRKKVADADVDAFDLWRSPAEHLHLLRFNDYNYQRSYRVCACCDGLLVVSLSRDRFFYICNPTTRQWITMPNLTVGRGSIFGLYPRGSSGEYRILYRDRKEDNDSTLCHVLTMGSSMASRGIGSYQASGLQSVTEGPSVLLHGCLHWVHREGGKVLVFDTDGESFRWMSAPTVDSNWAQSDLVQVDGTLGMSRINDSRIMMKIWMLQNRDEEVWLMKHQIKLPVGDMRSIVFTHDLYGMVLSENGDVLVFCPRSSHLFHCDCKGKLLQKFQWNGVFSCPTRHWFKESLVQHAFFQKKRIQLCPIA